MTWTIAWLLWLAAFAAIEGAALTRVKANATFSQHVWAWFHVRDPRPTGRTWVLRAVLLAFLIWLTGHLAFGWWSL